MTPVCPSCKGFYQHLFLLMLVRSVAYLEATLVNCFSKVLRLRTHNHPMHPELMRCAAADSQVRVLARVKTPVIKLIAAFLPNRRRLTD